jgi:hypothetical protein
MPNLSGEHVIDDKTARRYYPGVAHTHPQMYPGKMVPVWAVVMLEVLKHAGYLALGIAVNKILKRMRNDAQRHELVHALCSLVALSEENADGFRPAGGTNTQARVVEFVEAYFKEHGIPPLTNSESTNLDVALCA